MSQDAASYFLAVRAFGRPERLPIDVRRFEDIKRAWENLRQIVRIEEEWEAVIQNYLDLEKTLLEAAAHNMIQFHVDWNSFQELRLKFAVRLSNLLSTCKAYLDHTPHHLKALRPKDGAEEAFQALTATEYDARFGYRLMEALRNYAQHRGVPLHGTSHDTSRVEEGEDWLLQYSVATNIDVALLRDDKKFKRSVLGGVEETHLHVEPHIRSYVEGLNSVHIGMREHLKIRVDEWKRAIRAAIGEFRDSTGGGDTLGLYAVEAQENTDWVQQIPLVEDMLNRIELLQKRNRVLTNLTKRFVTSAPKREKTKR